MRKVFSYVSLIVILGLLVSCGSKKKDDKKPGPVKASFCQKILTTSDSALEDEGIQSLIEDICNNTSDIEAVMYTGGSAKKPIEIESTEQGTYSTVYFQGGLAISDVSPKVYFNMMKSQTKKDGEITEDNGYEIDEAVEEYKINDSSDTQVKYFYSKEIPDVDPPTPFDYNGIANFVTVENDSIYVVTSKLDTDLEKGDGEVSSMFSVSIILDGDNGGTKVYAATSQTSNNHGDHKASVKKAIKFFKEDQARSYKNAKHYRDRNPQI